MATAVDPKARTSVRVVVADPESAQRERMAALVKAAADGIGIEVVIDQASDGTTALAMCSDHRPRLLLCEILLEGLSGLELLRRMRREQGDHTAVVFVTSMSRDSDRYWGLRTGAHAYVVKPYDEAMLQERIHRLLADPNPPRERLV